MRGLLTAICLLLTSPRGIAQCPSNRGQLDLAASYGSISSDQIYLGVKQSGKTINYISGASFVSVRYFLYRVLALGFTGGVINQKGQYNDAFSPSVVTSTYTQTVTTIAPEVYYVYGFRKYFEAYTLIGIGPAFTKVTTTTNKTLYAPESVATTARDGLKMQYTPIGVRFGGRIGGFAELGFGYKGIINAGLSVKLGTPCWWKWI